MISILICVTSCNRLIEVKKNILPFLQFCSNNDRFSFVLSLDGNDSNYIDFCSRYNLPLIFSKKREGVGLSKNRVLKEFPNYNYYFFVDDDIEIINFSIFEKFIEVSRREHIHHLSYNVNDKVVKIRDKLIGGYKGGGCFNFYTKESIQKVGGWHTKFAEYKRFGHTEHSYRVYFQGLNPYPYVSLSNINKYLILNDPPHVTDIKSAKYINELIDDEQEMIEAKQDYFPLITLSEFSFNGCDVSISQLHNDLSRGRYSLLKGKEKIRAWGNFYFHKFKINYNPICLLLGLILYPNNNLIKHWLKNILIKLN